MRTEFARYQRQMLLAGFGEAGQAQLRQARILVLGCGALGSVSADLLTRAGVGHLTIVDRDFVELTNLQRQVLFDESDVAAGLPKAVAAHRKLSTINSEVDVTAIVDDLNHGNIERYAANVDLMIDGLDNLETRYLANDYAVRERLPYVYGAAVGTTGMAMPILPHGDGDAAWSDAQSTPCFRCVFDEPPPAGQIATCDTVGVVGPAVSIIASYQVAEALKILTGQFDRVARCLLNMDLWANEWHTLDVAGAYASGDCPCCHERRFDYLEGRRGSRAESLCGRNAVQLRHGQGQDDLDLGRLAERLGRHGAVSTNDYLLKATLADAGSEFVLTVFADGRAIVGGTDDPAVARNLYARFVGH